MPSSLDIFRALKVQWDAAATLADLPVYRDQAPDPALQSGKPYVIFTSISNVVNNGLKVQRELV